MASTTGRDMAAILSSLLSFHDEQHPSEESTDRPSIPQLLRMLQQSQNLASHLHAQASSLTLSTRTTALADARQLTQACCERARPGNNLSLGEKSAAVVACAGLLRGFCMARISKNQSIGDTTRGTISTVDWDPLVKSLSDALVSIANDACPWELRSERNNDNSSHLEPVLRRKFEARFVSMAERLALLHGLSLPIVNPHLAWGPLVEITGQQSDVDALYWLRCVALALARCHVDSMPLLAPPVIGLCLMSALLGDCVQLGGCHLAVLTQHSDDPTVAAAESPAVMELAETALARRGADSWRGEAGTLTRAVCDHYAFASMHDQIWMRGCFGIFSKGLAEGHRFYELHGLKKQHRLRRGYEQEGGKGDVALLLEASFLAVTIFFGAAVGDSVQAGWGDGFEGKGDLEREGEEAVDVDALEALSCVEFCRTAFGGYGPLVQRAVRRLEMGRGRGADDLCSRIPSYSSLVECPGLGRVWTDDDVAASRVHFLMRVLRPCIARVSDCTVERHLAPVLFLYLCHPKKDISMSAHALFASILASRDTARAAKGTNEDAAARQTSDMSAAGENETTLSEKFALFYMERCLEAYPEWTPFEGLVSGTEAIWKSLPPGSPATILCLRMIAERARTLANSRQETGGQNMSAVEDRGSWGKGAGAGRQGDARSVDAVPPAGERPREEPKLPDDPAARLRLLLMHAIHAVNLGALPLLLAELGELVLELPSHAERRAALASLFPVMAANDDYTRSPMTVPWFLRLHEICHGGVKRPWLPQT